MKTRVLYVSPDNTIKIELVYIVIKVLKIYPGIGKTYPKHTQCLVYINNILAGFSTVIKHEFDEDNQNYAYKLVTKKAMKFINTKFIRKEVWKRVNSELKLFDI